MHFEEAEWIAQRINNLRPEELSPVLNIGSSTWEFRTKYQPHIDSIIFQPLRYRGIVVIHQDIKQASGVDIVGDLTDQAFLNRLRKKPFKLVLCNNLLEHLPDRMPFLRALRDLIPPGGYLIITTPFEYPKHMDPIDTMYRPSISDLRDLFPEMDLLNSAEIDVGAVWKSLSQDLPKLVKLLVRAAIPFWKYNGWVTSVNKLLWLFKTRKITCVLLRKSNANCNTFT